MCSSLRQSGLGDLIPILCALSDPTQLRSILALACLSGWTLAAGAAGPLKFDFGPGPVMPGYAQVTTEMAFSVERGFGFEPGAVLVDYDHEGPDFLRGDGIASDRPFYFSAAVPAEGNYRVTVTLGDAAGESSTTIKAELRRLMVERIDTKTGGFATASFIVNTRVPQIAARGDSAAGVVRLKAPRETTQEAWAWDSLVTLEFNGRAPAVCAIEIEPVTVPTVYLIGDSTVCDQSQEPYNSWGQMLPRFFRPEVAIANHAESGETYRDSIGRRRLDKIVSVLRPGDWLFMQFGHNDQKQIAAGTGGPFTTYQEEMKRHISAVRAVGGRPVVVSPMERRGFAADGSVIGSLADYARASREVAAETGVPFIDLNAMSRTLYTALGPEQSARAFAFAGGKQDNTHHNNYGSYQLARCIVQGIREAKLDLAQSVVAGLASFDPARPDPLDAFAVPASPNFTNQRPLGD